MAPHVFFVLFNSDHQAALRIDHGMAAMCISIELYEIVQLSRWSHFTQFDMYYVHNIVALTIESKCTSFCSETLLIYCRVEH